MDDAKQQVVDRLKQASNILVTVRTNPTADLLSACIGMTLALDKLDKHAAAVFSGQIPSTIEFLKPQDTLEPTPDSLRDFIIARRWDAFLVLAFYLGPYLAWALLPRALAFIYYYLPSATTASLMLVYVLRREGVPRWLLWAFVAVALAGFAAMLPVSAAFVGTTMKTFNRLMVFQNWI